MTRKFEHKETGWIAKKVNHLPIDHLMLYDNAGNEQGGIYKKIITEGSDWQEITDELVEGRWYYADNCVFRYLYTVGRAIYGDNFVGGDYERVIGEGIIDTEESNVCNEEEVEREATPSEIHQALEAIRVEKGLVEGVKIETFNGEVKVIDTAKTRYQKSKDRLFIDIKNDFTSKNIGDNYISERCIYCQGQWASRVEPVLVTEDNVEKFDGDKIQYVDIECLGKGIKDIHEGSVDKSIAGFLSSIKTFHHKHNAQAYIENHKPRFSRADLEFLENEVREISKAWEEKTEVIQAFKSTIQNLKESK